MLFIELGFVTLYKRFFFFSKLHILLHLKHIKDAEVKKKKKNLVYFMYENNIFFFFANSILTTLTFTEALCII